MTSVRLFVALVVVAGYPGAACGQEWLDRLDEALRLRSPGGTVQSDVSVAFDVEAYAIDQRPPGLIFPDGRTAANPRLSLFVETRLGKHVYTLVEARVDRGFDPFERQHDARLDEYLLRYSPFENGRLHLQIGKFATVFGSWVPRHLSWDNPFITTPLPYDNITTVSDHVVPAYPSVFLARRQIAVKKGDWAPSCGDPCTRQAPWRSVRGIGSITRSR